MHSSSPLLSISMFIPTLALLLHTIPTSASPTSQNTNTPIVVCSAAPSFTLSGPYLDFSIYCSTFVKAMCTNSQLNVPGYSPAAPASTDAPTGPQACHESCKCVEDVGGDVTGVEFAIVDVDGEEEIQIVPVQTRKDRGRTGTATFSSFSSLSTSNATTRMTASTTRSSISSTPSASSAPPPRPIGPGDGHRIRYAQ